MDVIADVERLLATRNSISKSSRSYFVKLDDASKMAENPKPSRIAGTSIGGELFVELQSKNPSRLSVKQESHRKHTDADRQADTNCQQGLIVSKRLHFVVLVKCLEIHFLRSFSRLFPISEMSVRISLIDFFNSRRALFSFR